MHFDHLFKNKEFYALKRVALFCNQSSFDYKHNQYLFDLLIDQQCLKCILMPEHGLFSEIQDQEEIKDIKYRDILCHSLYDKRTDQDVKVLQYFKGVDGLVVDINDVGARYFTYTTLMFKLLEIVAKNYPELPIFIIDRPNPIGTKVEGTIIDPRYVSFLGPEHLIHRHGLSSGELCRYFISKENIALKINLIAFPVLEQKYFISPSPNLPTPMSLLVYPGQCFWEATNFSEGRGTTRPFEIFGHPNISSIHSHQIAEVFNKKFEGLASIRPTFFKPVFHKHMDTNCGGWQLIVLDPFNYHSLFGTLYLMKQIKNELEIQDFWRKGPYEFDSVHDAAKILIGDDELISFVDNEISESLILTKFEDGEQKWKQELNKLFNV